MDDILDCALMSCMSEQQSKAKSPVKITKSGATFSKVPRKILGKLLILGATDTQVAMSSRGYSANDEHCTNRPINSVQRSNRKL